MSLDAYRGLVMLAMVSSGFRFSQVAPKVRDNYAGTEWESSWRFLWDSLAYQFSHVAWVGCSFWDLIQPSFMFMVGVSLPFSAAKRKEMGQSYGRSFLHAAWRSVVLILLGVLLGSSIRDGVHFTFVNVLAQIGMGYLFLYLLAGQNLKTLFVAAVVVLLGYGAWFALQPIDETGVAETRSFLAEMHSREERSWSDEDVDSEQFTGWQAHWNKHVNAAAQVDRDFLNRFPRRENEDLSDRGFQANRGGYQTLNFIPSLATMIFGLMAGTVLRSDRTDGQRLKWLFKAGLLCFVVSMAADTTIWPTQWLSPDLKATFAKYDWSACPSVKRIWTPTWAVFSSGWTFWFLGVFYWLVDVKGCTKIVFPLAVVGLNSIVMYCMSHLIKGWLGGAMNLITRTTDQLSGTDLRYWLDYDRFAYAPILDYALRLLLMWMICLWLYRHRLFVRI